MIGDIYNFLIKAVYCRGSGLELLSAFLSFNSLNVFLKQRASSVRDAINIRPHKTQEEI